jgi:hypothetical protein
MQALDFRYGAPSGLLKKILSLVKPMSLPMDITERLAYFLSVLRERFAQPDQARLEKELMYSSHSLSSRLTEQDELLSFSQQRESEKVAFLRRKVQQGRCR